MTLIFELIIISGTSKRQRHLRLPTELLNSGGDSLWRAKRLTVCCLATCAEPIAGYMTMEESGPALVEEVNETEEARTKNTAMGGSTPRRRVTVGKTGTVLPSAYGGGVRLLESSEVSAD